MKATISQLWKTGRNIITFEGSDIDRPQTFSDLKKCDNVIVGDKVSPDTKIRHVLIDNSIEVVEPTKVAHPCGGTLYILEVL